MEFDDFNDFEDKGQYCPFRYDQQEGVVYCNGYQCALWDNENDQCIKVSQVHAAKRAADILEAQHQAIVELPLTALEVLGRPRTVQG